MAELRHRLRARYAECDPQGVVFNANYLTYFDVGLTELWREAIGPYHEVMKDRDIDLVLAEATLRYQAPIRFDDEFDVVATVSHLGTTSLITSIRLELDAGLAAEGEERHVFVRWATNEKTAMPDDVRAALEPYLRTR